MVCSMLTFLPTTHAMCLQGTKPPLLHEISFFFQSGTSHLEKNLVLW